jgi:hypothetical protein
MMYDPIAVYKQGQQYALAAAAQRVEALEVLLTDVRLNPDDPNDYRQAVLLSQCIDAIKGDQP